MSDFSLTPKLNISKIEIPKSSSIILAEANYASEFYKKIAKAIINFDSQLDNEHEVGVRLVSFGQSVVFYIEDMTYSNPSLISFIGHTPDGAPVELIQHVNQISVLLTTLPRERPEEPKKPFGFNL